MRSLRPYLELRADLVESVLGAHRTPGRVTGGTVGPRLIRFYIQPAPHVRFASIQRLSEDLALGLRVPQVRLSRGVEGVILEFDHPDPRPVTLAGVLQDVSPLPIATALLGLNEHSTPLLARLPSPDVAHILISGTTGCGKSVLLRSIIGLQHPAAGDVRVFGTDLRNASMQAQIGNGGQVSIATNPSDSGRTMTVVFNDLGSLLRFVGVYPQLQGGEGSFVLVHKGVMTSEAQRLVIEVVPDTGTGQLEGISGTLAIRIEGGKHYYDFDYELSSN